MATNFDTNWEDDAELERPVIERLQALVVTMKGCHDDRHGWIPKKLLQEPQRIAEERRDALNQIREEPEEERLVRLRAEARGFARSLRELAGKMQTAIEETKAKRRGLPLKWVQHLNTLVEGRAAALVMTFSGALPAWKR